MADEQPKQQDEVTPKGAVEVSEEDLDQAAGGIIIVNNSPADNVSLNFSKIEYSAQKVTPTNIAGAGPGAGPHVVPEKKI